MLTAIFGMSISDPTAAQSLAYALQLCIGAVFLTSVVPKLRDWRRFRQTLRSYEILPRALSGPAAAIVVLGEMALVLVLFSGRAITAGLVVGGALIACFAAATAINLWRGRDIDCGCFGAANEKISGRTLARLGILGIGLMALAGLIASGAAAAVTPAWWTEDGASLSYTLEVLGVGVGLTLFVAWALELPALLKALRRSEQMAGPADLSEPV